MTWRYMTWYEKKWNDIKKDYELKWNDKNGKKYAYIARIFSFTLKKKNTTSFFNTDFVFLVYCHCDVLMFPYLFYKMSTVWGKNDKSREEKEGEWKNKHKKRKKMVK